MLHLLNAMRAFEVAARLGSIRRAAEELRVSDGAVSRHIKNLEDELGVPLFERGNRSLKLTPAAATFAATLTEALASINRGTEHLRALHDQSTIMLTAPDTFLLRWLVPRLQGLEKALGGVSVRITTWTREINPADRSIDIYVGVGKPLDIPGMIVSPVAPETFGPVISPMIVRGRTIDAAAIWQMPRLDIRWPPDMWTNWAREAGIVLPQRESVWYDSLSFSVQAAEAGQGVAIGPGPAIWDALEQNRLIAPLGMVTRSGYWFLAWREDRPNRMMQTVRRWFEMEMARGLKFETGGGSSSSQARP
ncbi:LysR family transcriptional regulator [Devosia sp.]|uniref:LysR family transcriptional regulator n=1 Tax=Devosia sp. TaxID=1871048 RepID=UPI001B0BDE3D|nr:LysR family transcriptional regulator [Devosia sp.]MBO9588998.1 LysR family transcriptional regulator [Devosia sp.]